MSNSEVFRTVYMQEQQQLFWSHCQNAFAPYLPELSAEQLTHLQRSISLSDFVRETLVSTPQLLPQVFAEPLEHEFSALELTQQLQSLLHDCQEEEQLHRILRQFRNRYMVRFAINDFCSALPIQISLRHLTDLAEVLITQALQWLTEYCQQRWGQPVDAEGNIQPLLVYGMGKLGGGELNFSSDIDLIFAYPHSGETQGARKSIDNQQFFTRLGQKLIAALNQVTVDGFVYRVDMRLRPFGESGPLVLSFSALENYYQDQGRDWERYAMLKARLIGNTEYNKRLSSMLRPFVYRRYIDFSVIESFRKMKLMIAQEARRKSVQNNIKLGQGGIREIEFIVQVFQLIRGGRNPELQERNIYKALDLLTDHGSINPETRQTLLNSYNFLRRSENAIQAFADKQTQLLPQDELNRTRLMEMMGGDSWEDYHQQCRQHMAQVHHEFNLLIGEDNPNELPLSDKWVTYWLANWEQDESISWLENLQPQWPADDIHQTLVNFKKDIHKRPIGRRGQIILDKLIPLLLSLIDKESPLITLNRCLHVLLKIVSRTAYLELLYENQGALKQLIKLCRESEWISETLAKFPILLDELIDPKLLMSLPELEDYQTLLRESLLRVPNDDLEEQMETLRRFKQSHQLKIAAADVSDVLPVMKVSDQLTGLAQGIVAEVIDLAWQQMCARYGQPAHTLGTDNKGFAVLGYGKLGGIELGYSSDLDMVFVHNCEPNDMTTGDKQVPASQFYLKMAQRILHLFNTRTASGTLYEADMRLRPSGNSGLMVVHINTYHQYLKKDAWTWEHQALVRARAVAGDSDLVSQFSLIRKDILSSNRERTKLRGDVINMREKMRKHLDKSDANLFDIKQGEGGLADIEFMAQYFVLSFSHEHESLGEYSDNVRIFERLGEFGLIEAQTAKQLASSYCALRDLGHELVLQNRPKMSDRGLIESHTELVWRCWSNYLLNAEE
ncbi:bifunctional [glutamate--ammonia ligase]-adenylyl-L-tyrosine phosphorylase/[glutamate--ammonia-ligase] adenylyltransferase [Thalassotalea sp. PS06]|uniref:bifunctional [glutamate--ammonia ligase]-adenylyl-L-tyrosine phosphorylase/[glutamate--ammonia-ligase] adenylyltransferase n=1 Tax=Thalassotalea sp. PS06 TaxID=2594005 RepID=UPI0011625A7B|nr:bifunctional [glutamate--ammonia ligase]-adenylyl-L-tyrosine phosphorylase/[glutamate--ammonia-ligase] adenylyltransferase [Thalassotalea sp. PS06]QDP02264.1 bifunctional [glutamate--ammonia ligase]-adenylyl-L-tyrosine phosphorylase/[glutamate--ammonia-ligase] adenylyltransferase [Thalassotalea sp. PS06]